MKGKKIKDILATVAPTLASAIGGPLAGVAAQAITGKLSDKPVRDLKAVEAVLDGASAQDMIALKELELEFAAKMEEAGIELAQIEASDRHSARDRQVRMKDWTPSILGLVILIGFFGILAYILRYGLPSEGREVLMIMFGALATLSSQVANFFFGSSAGSKSKDLTISQLKGAQ